MKSLKGCLIKILQVQLSLRVFGRLFVFLSGDLVFLTA